MPNVACGHWRISSLTTGCLIGGQSGSSQALPKRQADPIRSCRRRCRARMRRREFLSLVSGTVAMRPLVARAQQVPKFYRIGYLALLPGERVTLAKVFLQRLQDLGYSDGNNIVFDYRSAEGRVDRVSELAAELV